MRSSINGLALPQITDLLCAGGISPVAITDTYCVYPTPFRPSGAHSLIVSHKVNTWKDTGMHGLGDDRITVRGDVVTFCIASGLASGRDEALEFLFDYMNGGIQSIDFSGAVQFQEDLYFYLINPVSGDDQIRVTATKAIESPRMISFLKERNISVDIAQQYCHEAILEQGNHIRSVDYALLFKNRTGGYLTISTCETKQIGHPDITIWNAENPSDVLVFSHQLDLLSYATMHGLPTEAIIVMNHQVNASDAVEYASKFNTANFFIRRNKLTDYYLRIIKGCTATLVAEPVLGWKQYNSIEEALINENNTEK